MNIFFLFFFWGGGGGGGGGGGYEEIVDVLRGHHTTGLVLGVFFVCWGLLLRSRYRMKIFFRAAKISNILLGMPDTGIPDILYIY